MGPRSEVRRVNVAGGSGRDIEATVRVRGFDAALPFGRVVLERHEPLALVVRDGHAVRQHLFPRTRSTDAMLILAAAPIAAITLTRLFTRRRKP